MAEESSSINSPPDECESPAPSSSLSSTSVSLATVVEEMTEAIERIKNTTGDISAVSDNTTILENKVHDLYSTYETKSQRLYLGDHLANIGAAEVITSNIAWLRGMEHGGFSEDVWPYMECLYHCCETYTNFSQKFAEELGKAKIIPILVQNLHEFKETYTTDEKCEVIVVTSLCTLYNTSMLSPTTRPLFREINAVESLTHYLKADNEKFKTFATLTLAYVIDEKNLGIVADPSVICFIIELFTEAVDEETKMCRGYSATELAMGIERLAVNDTPDDDNKLTLVKEGVLPPLFKLMAEGDDEQQFCAIRAVSQLAFHSSNREEIRPFIPQLEKIKERGTGIVQAASGTLWQLKDAESRQQKVVATGDADGSRKNSRVRHVMLSYQWDNQETVKKIRAALEAKGYKVWMDIEQMGGSTLDSMAGAVEGAAVVLICMSRKYKESANCRGECEYTRERGTDIIPLKMEDSYKPDGWLGFLVGARLFFNFDCQDSFEDVMSRLIKEIGDRGKEHAVTDLEVDAVTSKPQWLNPDEWASEDIRTWAQENQLEGDLTKLEPEDVHFLRRMRKEAPAEFYRSIENDYGMKSVSSKRKLANALDKLKSQTFRQDKSVVKSSICQLI